MNARVAFSGLACLTMILAQRAHAQAAESAAPAMASGDIIVTARRREELARDVPISVASINGEALARRGVQQVDDLQRTMPSLKLSTTVGRRSNSQYEIRGVTTTDSLITQDPSVGVYIDEVYRARATGTNQNLYDIDNVQVLYGPQGTLFGRNSTGGAVLINTKRPTSDFDARLEAGVGNYDRLEFGGFLNVPVSDALKLRFAGQRIKQDGFGVNITNGTRLSSADRWGGRFSAVWEPTTSIRNTIIASYYHANDAGTITALYAIRPCPTVTGVPRPAATCSATLGPAIVSAFAAQQQRDFYHIANDPTVRDFDAAANIINRFDQYEHVRNFSVVNQTEVNLSDHVLLKNIFGYNFVSLRAANDNDGTPVKVVDLFIDTQNRSYSNELQLQGTGDRLNWTIGALYFQEKGVDRQDVTQLVTTLTRQTLRGRNISLAGFAQASYKIWPNVTFTAGVRYTQDKRRAIYDNPTTQSGNGPILCAFPANLTTTCMIQVDKRFRQPTYTVTLDWKPSPATLVYLAHRRGYRAGGAQSRVANSAFALTPFEPETVQDIEAGFKGDFRLGGEVRVQPSLAVYRAWYKDIQKQISAINPSTNSVVNLIVNAAQAHVTGFEAQLGIDAGPLSVTAYGGYVNGIYDTFQNNGIVFINVPFTASKWTGGINGALTAHESDAFGKVVLTANYSYRSSYNGENALPLILPESRIPGQHNLNAAINWDNIGGSNVSGSLWMKNITNETQFLGVQALASSLGIVPVGIGEPRTYGLRLSYRFGGWR